LDCTFPSAIRRPPQTKRVRWSTHIWVVLVSLLGGVLGIGGAFLGEVGSGGILLGVFIGAPVIEEAFKPIGVYLALVKCAEQSALHRSALRGGGSRLRDTGGNCLPVRLRARS
jgi:hypothetical protein